jgi:DNA adenine methylase
LQGVVIENRPAADVLTARDRADCLHYVDPPYTHGTRAAGQQNNYRFEMTDDQHRELSAVLHSLEGGVIVSGYPSGLYEDLYGDWRRVDRAALADGAAKRTECLWLSPSVSARLQMCLPLEAL